jgi:hypothetical protein
MPRSTSRSHPTPNAKYEHLTGQFARELDVTDIKLHGIKDLIEFIDSVRTVVQLKTLLNDLELLQIGGRLFNIFQDFSKINLDLVAQTACSKHTDAYGTYDIPEQLRMKKSRLLAYLSLSRAKIS